MQQRLSLTLACALSALVLACGPGATNHSPLFATLPQIDLAAGRQVTYTVPVVHPDGEVTLAVESAPDWIAVEDLSLIFSPEDGHEGKHELTLVATRGEAKATATLTVLVSQRPTLTGTLSINRGASHTSNRNVALVVSVTASKGAVPDSVRVSLDGATFGEARPFTPILDFELPEEEGEHTVHVEVIDSFGATGRFSSSIVLDSFGPAGTVALGDDSGWTNARDVPVVWALDEPAASFAGICFTSPGGKHCADEPEGSTQLPLADVDGHQTVQIVATDVAGNVFEDTRRIGLDRAPPYVELTIGEGDGFTSSPDLPLKFTAFDTTSGLGDMRISTDDGLTWTPWEPFAFNHTHTVSSQGQWTVLVEVRDQAGNSTTASAGVHYDPSSPTLALRLSDDRSGTQTPLVEFSYDVSAGSDFAEICLEEMGGAVDCTLTEGTARTKAWYLLGDDGKRTFTLSARTSTGAQASITRDFWLDGKAPVLTRVILNDGNPYSNAESVPFAFELDGETPNSSPIEQICFNLSGESSCHTPSPLQALFLPRTDATYDWEAVVIDAAGNASEPVAGSITVDQTPPVVQVLAINGDAFSHPSVRDRSIQMSIHAFDPNGAPMELNFGDDAGWVPPTTCKVFELPDEDGVHSLVVRARDQAGNESSTSIDVTLDRVAPTGSFTIVDNDDWIRSSTLALHLDASDDVAVTEYCAVVGETPPDEYSDCWTTYHGELVYPFSLTNHGSPQGHLTVTVRYRDRAGNLSVPTSESAKVDFSPPVFGSNDFLRAEAKHRSVHLEWPEATDANGIDAYLLRFSHDRGYFDREISSETTELVVDELMNTIEYTITLKARDGTGWESTPLRTTLTPRFAFDFAQRLPTSADLNAIARGMDYIAVGEGGVLLRSEDGVEFTRGDSGVENNLNAIALTSAWGVAVGNGVVLVTNDGGYHWHRDPTFTHEEFRDVAWLGSRTEDGVHGHLFVAVGRQGVYRGLLEVYGTQIQWTQISALPSRGVAVCPAGTCGDDAVVVVTRDHEWSGPHSLRLLYSTNDARSFIELSHIGVPRFGTRITWSNSPQPGFYVATADPSFSSNVDRIYRFDSQGQNPTWLSELPAWSVRDIRPVEGGIVLVGGNIVGDNVIRLDGDTVSTFAAPPTEGYLIGVVPLTGKGYLAVGSVGTLFRHDAGAPPQVLSSGTTGVTSALSLSPSWVWRIGSGGLGRAPRSGGSFDVLDNASGPAMAAASDDKAFFTLGTQLRYYSDGSIYNATQSSSNAVRALTCTSANHCLAAGDSHSLYQRSADAAFFNEIAIGVAGSWTGVARCSASLAVVVGDAGRIGLYDFNAENLTTRTITDAHLRGVSCDGSDIVVTSQNGIHVSTDAGATWTLANATNVMNGDVSYDALTGTWWAAGYDGLLRSTDLVTWTQVPLAYDGSPDLRAVVAEGGVVWVGGQNGHFMVSRTNGE